MAPDNSTAQRELIAQLESKNKEIMREIARLRRQQEQEQLTAQQQEQSPALMVELRALRQRKGELEGHLGTLQDSRRQLMVQLEGLMRMLKSQQQQTSVGSPRSTPNSSPRSGKSPPMPALSQCKSNLKLTTASILIKYFNYSVSATTASSTFTIEQPGANWSAPASAAAAS